jgi:predicted transcriptional regulator
MIENVAQIVAAFVKRNQVPSVELPALIEQVKQSLGNLSQPAAPVATLTPAVPIRGSVSAETIACLDCGKKSKMLRRHLFTAHSLSPNEYRTRWGLAADYPMVARNYSERRSELAKLVGLGRGGVRQVAAPPIEEPPSPVPPPMFTDDDVAPKRRGRPRRSKE